MTEACDDLTRQAASQLMSDAVGPIRRRYDGALWFCVLVFFLRGGQVLSVSGPDHHPHVCRGVGRLNVGPGRLVSERR